LAFNTKKHDKVISKTIDNLQSGAFDTVKALENEVADLVNLNLPIESVRPQLISSFNKYSNDVRNVADPLVDVSQDYVSQSTAPALPSDFTTQSALLDLSKDSLSATVSGQAEDVVSTVVLGTVAGLTAAQIANQARGRISGVYMESNDPDIRRDQRKLRKLIKAGGQATAVGALTASIKNKLPGDVNTAASLATKLANKVESTVGSFNGAFSKARAKATKVEKFQYAGGVMATSRPFCLDMLGQELTEQEIYDIWDGSSWAGKEPGDPFVVRGGYNCQHYWVPIESDED
jgi:hypothetical protein